MSDTGSTIAGLGAFLPERRVSSAEISERVRTATGFDLPEEFIERMTGIRERRYAAAGQHPSDLACEAGRRALADAGLQPGDVDTLIFASACQDLAEPATANLVQQQLGISQAQAFDVKNACNGLLSATNVADALIRTGKARNVLVVAGEVCSYFVDYRIRDGRDLHSLLSGLTLGDAGGAFLLRPSESRSLGIRYTRFRSFGEHWPLSVVYGGTRGDRDWGHFHCESRELFEVAFSKMVPQLRASADELGWSAADIDLVVAHQVADCLIRRIAAECGFDAERCAFSLPYAGNTAAASIPLALHQARKEGRLRKGSRVLLVGGAAGFSVGIVGLVWSH